MSRLLKTHNKNNEGAGIGYPRYLRRPFKGHATFQMNKHKTMIDHNSLDEDRSLFDVTKVDLKPPRINDSTHNAHQLN